jgi:hypothetical protein
MMRTILITNDPALALDAEAAGVGRVMVDLESIGKKERQSSRATFISSHTPADIPRVSEVLREAELIVRINPIHEGSAAEIDAAVQGGADWVMLPMITDLSQVHEALRLLQSRTRLLPLIETSESMHQLEQMVRSNEIQECFFGLNDLHLSLGMDFLFEPLARGMVDAMATIMKRHHKPFGFGGLGAISGSAELPALQVLAEHARLGSSCVILSSRFHKDLALAEPSGRKQRLQSALADIQHHYSALLARTHEEQSSDFSATCQRILQLAETARHKRNSA